MDGTGSVGVCSIEGCEKPVKARGWCGAHYMAWVTHGDPLINKRKRAVIGPCSVYGCGKPAKVRGLCPPHYKALVRHGDPTISKRLKPRKLCAAAGCPELTTVEYCDAHRHRFLRHGSPDVKPPRGRRPFHGPCSVIGCGRIATRSGHCPRHQRSAEGMETPRRMLSQDAIDQIRANPQGLPIPQLAEQFDVYASTVIAVRQGRNWGYLRSR